MYSELQQVSKAGFSNMATRIPLGILGLSNNPFEMCQFHFSCHLGEYLF